MLTLASPSYDPVYLEWVFVISAFMIMQVGVRLGMSRIGACFISYGLAIVLHYILWNLIPYTDGIWYQFVKLFDYQLWYSQRFRDTTNRALMCYVIIPWLVLISTVRLIPKKSPPDTHAQPASPADNNATKTQSLCRSLNEFKIIHRSYIALIAAYLVILVWMNEPPVWVSAAMLSTVLVIALWLLYLQTSLASEILGKDYARGYLLLTVAMSYVFLLGILLVPFLVIYDVKHSLAQLQNAASGSTALLEPSCQNTTRDVNNG